MRNEETSVSMSNINIRRVIDNIRSGTTVYTPVIELIVNAIQAMPEGQAETGRIEVTVLRAQEHGLFDQVPAVDGFEVRDNGVGFDYKGRASETGLGLRNILSRTEIMGGTLFMETARGKGTHYIIEIPQNHD